jgi:hypothetical protein
MPAQNERATRRLNALKLGREPELLAQSKGGGLLRQHRVRARLDREACRPLGGNQSAGPRRRLEHGRPKPPPNQLECRAQSADASADHNDLVIW